MNIFDLPSSHLSDGVVSFEDRLRLENMRLRRARLSTVQINLGRLCNQACKHCHLEAGPNRQEIMSQATAEQAVDFVRTSRAANIDLTGGAPELNPSFRFLVTELRRLGLHVIDRSNLTVFFEPGLEDLPDFLAAQQVEIIASLPCYTEENVDRQRGKGVFQKSIQALQRLNSLGYAQPGTSLILNLIYNPLDAVLPGQQETLEAEYRQELSTRYGLQFNHLYILTNLPVGRFAQTLQKAGDLEHYSSLLMKAFNPRVLPHLMCLHQVSLSWDGYFYDCDFNQAANLPLRNGRLFRLGDQTAAQLVAQLAGLPVRTGSHCFGCTAGTGSSCQGSLL